MSSQPKLSKDTTKVDHMNLKYTKLAYVNFRCMTIEPHHRCTTNGNLVTSPPPRSTWPLFHLLRTSRGQGDCLCYSVPSVLSVASALHVGGVCHLPPFILACVESWAFKWDLSPKCERKSWIFWYFFRILRYSVIFLLGFLSSLHLFSLCGIFFGSLHFECILFVYSILLVFSIQGFFILLITSSVPFFIWILPVFCWFSLTCCYFVDS